MGTSKFASGYIKTHTCFLDYEPDLQNMILNSVNRNVFSWVCIYPGSIIVAHHLTQALGDSVVPDRPKCMKSNKELHTVC